MPEMRHLMPEEIRLHGEVAARLQRAADNMHSWIGTRSGPTLIGDTADYGWGADFQGRWTESMAILSRSVDVPVPDLQRIADGMLGHQRRDGSFHTTLHTMVQNGNSRALAALVEMYRLGRDRKYLRAAEKLAGWYDRNFRKDRDASSWLTMALEAIVELWKETGKPQHLALARRFAQFTRRQCERGFPEHTHAHSVALSVRGLLAYIIASGDRRCLPLVVRTWESMQEETVWVTGGLPEVFTNSIEADEPCGTADWLTISLQLWQLTAKERYIAAAEKTLLNHLWFNQLPNGGFSSTSNIEQGFRGLEAWWCCSMHAPLGIEKLTRYACTYSARVIQVNLFLPADMTIPLREDLAVRIEQRTDLPRDTHTRLTISPEREAAFALRIRVPAWADAAQVTLNGKREPGGERDGYLVLRRRWRTGDVVDVDFRMRMTAVADVQGSHDRWMEAPVVIDGVACKAKRIAVTWGPLVLAVFRPLHGNDLTWVYRGGYNEVLDAGGMTGSTGSCRNYVGLNGTIYSDDAGNKSLLGPIKITTSPKGVRLTWKEALGGEGLAELHYEVRVLPGLPLRIEDRETLVIKARAKRPVRVESLLLAGTRFTERSEQYHDTYKRIWKYEYPPVQIASAGGRRRAIRDGNVVATNGRLEMGNGIFDVRVDYDGDARRVIELRRDDWAGVYFAPAGKASRRLTKRTTWTVRRRLQFSCEDYAERTFMPSEWTHGLMTQPINTA